MVQTYEKELGALQRRNSEADSLFLKRVCVDLVRRGDDFDELMPQVDLD